MTKKFISIFLTLALCLSLLPAAAVATEEPDDYEAPSFSEEEPDIDIDAEVGQNAITVTWYKPDAEELPLVSCEITAEAEGE